MNDDLQALHALPLAAADLAVGAVLARYVSVPIGVMLAVFGVFVLCVVTYRTLWRGDPSDSRRQVV